MEWETKQMGPRRRRWERSWCFSNYFTACEYNSAAIGGISTGMKSTRILSILLASALVGGAGVTAMAQNNNDAGQDLKAAGNHAKDAAKDAGQATKSTTKKAYHKSKKGTKKAYHKTKEGTRRAYNKTKEGAQNTRDKVKEKRQNDEENPQ